MEDWLEEFARALGDRPPSREELGAMLRLSRQVAHGVERKFAPLSTFVAGMHVARRVTEGATEEEALAEVLAAAKALLPPEEGAES
jgi:hypothetical protein